MMTCTVRKFGVGVASLALVASMAVPALADMMPSPTYDVARLRVAGADRIDTAIAVAKHQFTDDYIKWVGSSSHGKPAMKLVAYLAGAQAAADSATAGAMPDGPILLVKSDGSANEKVAEYLKALGPEKVVALGGTSVVSEENLKDIANKAGEIPTERLAGADRFETSVQIAKHWSSVWQQFTPGQVILANGESLVDALTAGTIDSPILLTKNDGTLPDSVLEYLKTVKPQSFIAVGGTKVIPDSTVLQAQYTALADTTLSTDDSLPDLLTKLNVWKEKARDGGELDLAAKASQNLAKAANVAQRQKELDLEKALLALKTKAASFEGKDTDGKRFTNETLVKDTRLTAELNAVMTQLDQMYYSRTSLSLDKKYFKVTAASISLDEAALRKEGTGDLVDEATKQIKQFNNKRRNKSELTDLAAAAVADDVTSAIMSYNTVAVNEAYKLRADLDAAAFQSAKDTLSFLQRKVAGVNDQLQGKKYLRLGGADRYGTSAAISAHLQNAHGQNWVRNIYVANGTALADATVAGTLTGGPILLAKSDTELTTTVNNEIIRAAKNGTAGQLVEVYAIGGNKVVSDTLLKAANATALVAQRGTGTQVAPKASLYASDVTVKVGTTAGNSELSIDGTKVGETASAARVVSGTGNHNLTFSYGTAGKITVTPTAQSEPGVYTVQAKVGEKTVEFKVTIKPADPSNNGGNQTDDLKGADGSLIKIGTIASATSYDSFKIGKITLDNGLDATKFHTETATINPADGVLKMNVDAGLTNPDHNGKIIKVKVTGVKNGISSDEVELSFTTHVTA